MADMAGEADDRPALKTIKAIDAGEVTAFMDKFEAGEDTSDAGKSQPEPEAAEPAAEPESGATETESQPEPTQGAGAAATGQSAKAAPVKGKSAPPSGDGSVSVALKSGRILQIPADKLADYAARGASSEEQEQGFQAYKAKAEAELASRAKELDAFLDKVKPYKTKLDEMLKAEREAEEADPALKAQREAERARAEIAELRKERTAETTAAQAKAQQEQAQASVRTLMAEVTQHKAKYVKEFDKLPVDLKAELDERILLRIAHRGYTPERAVQEVATSLGAYRAVERNGVLKAKAAQIATARVPGRAASPPTKAPATLDRRRALYDGTADKAALAFLEQSEGDGE